MRRIIFLSIIQHLLYITSRVESLTGQNLTRIQSGEFKFIASLQHFPKREHFCGGALIAKGYVITTKHCLRDETPQSFRIVFEAATGPGAGVEHVVHSWTTYVDWSRRHASLYDAFIVHDVAVITLLDKVHDITPVPLSKFKKSELANRWAIVTGWKNRALHKVPVILLNDEECNEKIHELNNEIDVDDRTLCSSHPFALEDGDGGAPLLSPVDNTLLGIAFGSTPDDHYIRGNFSKALIQQHRVNLHISVSYYENFIRGAAWV